MKLKKVAAVSMAAAMVMSLAACGDKAENSTEATTSADTEATTAAEGDSSEDATTEESGNEGSGELSYASIKLGEDYTDLTATIKVLTNRTDMLEDGYAGKGFKEYVEEFNKVYPNITVEYEGITDYANDALLRLQGEDWGDIMMIPAIDKDQLPTYFLSYGDLTTMDSLIQFATDKEYDGQVYGIPSTGNANGIVYNKKVFEQAGITELPKTPDEFIDALQKIKDNTDAIPLYTNYAAGWTFEQWEPHISGTATGKSDYMNQTLLHTAAPFTDPGDGTGAYNVYKILYDAVAKGLTEDDYSTTDWEGSKGMINNGEIGCMVLGSWAFPQMQAGGPNPDDIGYMPFPITVNGKQYASAGPNYGYGINVKASDDNKIASMIYVKWLTEESHFAYNEGGIPIAKSETEWPEVYSVFNDVELVTDDPAVAGEEKLKDTLNADSELMLNNGGSEKMKVLVEEAASGGKSFDDIMAEWNQKWSDAQVANGVEQKY
ncbi:MAG: ABC transporter substrate-binding protein [Coprococcus sp.]